jgi:hypothetical protein
MSDKAWISRAPAHASNLRPLRHGFSDDESKREVFDSARKRIEAGEPIGPDDFPAEIYGAPHATEKDYQLPDLFFAYGYWAVSKAAADVMRRFDLGQASFSPVRVLKNDRSTPVGGEWLLISFGNRKNTVVPEQSTGLRPFVRDIFSTSSKLEDNQIALGPEASRPPEVWIEEKIDSAILFSSALGDALRKAKTDKGFFFKKCRIV